MEHGGCGTHAGRRTPGAENPARPAARDAAAALTFRILMRVHPHIRVLAGAALLALLTISSAAQSSSSPAWLAPYREVAARLIKTSTADDFAWQRLSEFSDTFRPRL